MEQGASQSPWEIQATSLIFSAYSKYIKNEEMGWPQWPSGLAPPLAQGVILGTQDQVPCQDPCMEPASPSACASASLSLMFIINK